MFKIAAGSLVLGLILWPFVAPVVLAAAALGIKIAVPVCVASVTGLILSKSG